MIFGTILTMVFKDLSEITSDFKEKRAQEAIRVSERKKEIRAQKEDQKRAIGGEIEVIEIPRNQYIEIDRYIDRMILIISPGATAKIPTFRNTFRWEVQQGCVYLSTLYDAEGKTKAKAIKKEDRLNGYPYTIQISQSDEIIEVPRKEYEKFVYLLVHCPRESEESVEFSFERIFN